MFEGIIQYMTIIEKTETLRRNYSKLHSLSPYIGKIRPALGSRLIKKYAKKNKDSYIFDPFCGSGTIPLEGWLHGYNVIGADLNWYAVVLSLGKLNPPPDIKQAINKLNKS